MSNVTIEALRGFYAGGVVIEPGRVIDLPHTQARELVAMNKARIVEPAAAADDEAAAEVDAPAEPARKKRA
jgi:hypothetical protein